MATPPHQSLYRAEQVRELDRLAIEQQGIAGIVLMKRAAQALLQVMLATWPAARVVQVFCGGGNNAGDGYLLAALAQQRGMQASVTALRDPAHLRGDAKLAWEQALAANVTIEVVAANAPGVTVQPTADVVVDALLGTGLKDTVRTDYAAAIECINNSHVPVLAADLPSGLNSDTGAVMGVAVRAAQTVSFVALKPGLFTAAGPAYSGAVSVSQLGIPAAVYQQQQAAATVLHLPDLLASKPSRQRDAHKGRHGHVLVIGGNDGMGGAVALAARAALYSGAGLVSVFTRTAHLPALLAQQPELMVTGSDQAADVEGLLAGCSSIVIGPGLGRTPWAVRLLQLCLRRAGERPLIVDADALNIVASRQLWPALRALNAIYTPHPGEAGRLLGTSAAAINADRLTAAAQLCDRLGGVVLLKGAGTVVQVPGAVPVICPYGNPGMASGGMGDVLAGVLAALCAQGLDTASAIQLGTCLHSAAADQAVRAGAGPVGLLASELFEPLRALCNATAYDAAQLTDGGHQVTELR